MQNDLLSQHNLQIELFIEMQLDLLSQQKLQIKMRNDLQIDLQNEELQKDSLTDQHGLQIDLQSVLCVSGFIFDTNTTPY